MSRQRGHWKYWPLWVGTTGTISSTDTTDVIAVPVARTGDYVMVTPANAAAAALAGSATGVYAAVSALGQITVTFPSAAGGEVFNVALFPAQL